MLVSLGMSRVRLAPDLTFLETQRSEFFNEECFERVF